MASLQTREEAFKGVLLKLSHNLRQENVRDLAVLGSVTSSETAIDVLKKLWEKGYFSPNSCAGLDKLLRDIDRYDLVERYTDTYGASDPPPNRK